MGMWNTRFVRSVAIGQVVDGEKFLGFDGKYILPNATPVYLYKK